MTVLGKRPSTTRVVAVKPLGYLGIYRWARVSRHFAPLREYLNSVGLDISNVINFIATSIEQHVESRDDDGDIGSLMSDLTHLMKRYEHCGIFTSTQFPTPKTLLEINTLRDRLSSLWRKHRKTFDDLEDVVNSIYWEDEIQCTISHMTTAWRAARPELDLLLGPMHMG